MAQAPFHQILRVIRVASKREGGEVQWTIDATSEHGYSILAMPAELAEALKTGDQVKVTVEIS